ncbi:hypothetical protein K7X08_009996 [Anisodus acutangulus]|uniref:Pentatricopeptide repeat-containing protein n=1 Tax=Anisodus acutangulus TaxID=402998 RepID=A0A9Q1RRB6_9SOLA|nr:hypothetical protein K7X08_009996 [Anisodus acutangulus]
MVNRVHDDVLEMGFGSDLYICNALIDMYSRMNELGNARKVFDKMPQRDVVSWNSLISGYSANVYWEEALEAFREGRLSGVDADAFTVASVLPACGGLMEVEQGQIVHGLVEKSGTKGDMNMERSLQLRKLRIYDMKTIWRYRVAGLMHYSTSKRDAKILRTSVSV